jgi:hypothetical protein
MVILCSVAVTASRFSHGVGQLILSHSGQRVACNTLFSQLGTALTRKGSGLYCEYELSCRSGMINGASYPNVILYDLSITIG